VAAGGGGVVVVVDREQTCVPLSAMHGGQACNENVWEAIIAFNDDVHCLQQSVCHVVLETGHNLPCALVAVQDSDRHCQVVERADVLVEVRVVLLGDVWVGDVHSLVFGRPVEDSPGSE
jgi:hypothetical protein